VVGQNKQRTAINNRLRESDKVIIAAAQLHFAKQRFFGEKMAAEKENFKKEAAAAAGK